MPLIDQRILIDAPPDAVWQVISDQSQLVRWHAGYTSVSVLTTQQRGSGVRRRCALASGKDVIEEISAWVEGMGYEYHRVEGGPYKSYQGRLRLQLGPDGTSVQWTLNYTPKGVFGFVKDRLGGNRALAQMVTDSLRQLRREVDALGQRMNEEARARASIRGRLNADERAAYAARQAAASDGQGVEVGEPPAKPAQVAAPAPAEPSFVSELAAIEPAVDPMADTQPQSAPSAPAAREGAEAPAPPAADQADEDEIPLHQRVTPAHGIPSVQPSSSVVERPAPHAPEPPIPLPAEIKPPVPEAPPPGEIKPPAPPAQAEVDPYARFRRPADATKELAGTPPGGLRPAELAKEAAASPPEARPGLPPQTPITDTGEISIWEVFGLRRPSDQDADALEDLIQSLQARRMAEQRLKGRFVRGAARVRFREGALGLRLKLALSAARVRLMRQRASGTGREE